MPEQKQVQTAVPEPDLVTVGEEDEGVDAVLELHAVRVTRRLALTLQRLAQVALDLVDGNGAPIRKDQGVIDERVLDRCSVIRPHGPVSGKEEFIHHAARRAGSASLGKLAVNALRAGDGLQFGAHGPLDRQIGTWRNSFRACPGGVFLTVRSCHRLRLLRGRYPQHG